MVGYLPDTKTLLPDVRSFEPTYLLGVPRVFEKGYTGYNGRGGQKSTGLGLYLVHQTAEMLHCRVSLSSRIGEGTSVTIDLHQEELGKE